MAFQSVVLATPGFGKPGTKFDDSPFAALSYTLNSADAAYNIVGAVGTTLVSEGIIKAGGTGVFTGILVDPDIQALFGSSSGSLAPSLTLPNYAIAPACTLGRIYITLPSGAVNIGDSIIFDNVTGALSAIAPGADLPVGKTFAQAQVIRYNVGSSGGLAVVQVAPTFVIPQLA